MLDHQKIILIAVSGNKDLFRKELIKSMLWLDEPDQLKLKKWLHEKFWDEHSEIISEVLYSGKTYA